MNGERNDLLATAPLGRLMSRYAAPCVVSLLVAALYNIVDQIFIANADYLGSYGNAANTVVFPLTVVALALAVMIGDGCCAFVSLRLGAGKKDEAGAAVGSATVLTAAVSLMLTALYLVFDEQLLTLFGGRVNPETFALAKEYFFYITLGLPAYMVGQALNPIIRADGSPRRAMAATLAGAALNVALDPLFIFVFRWGMMGAAVATVLGQLLTAALSAACLCRTRAVTLGRDSFRFRGPLMRAYLPLGLCSFLSQISLVAAMAAINNMVRKYGALDPVFGQTAYAQIPMAVIGIVMKFFQIVISIVVGMAAGCIPVVGYNMGAGRPDRAKSLFSRLLLAEACVGAAALLLVELCPRQLIGVFGAAGESAHYTAFAVRSFRIYLCMMIPACVNKAAFIYLQALGRAWASTLLSMLREVALGVGLALLLPRFWGLDGVLWSMPAADLLTFFASAAVIAGTYRLLNAPGPGPLAEAAE